MEIIWKDIVGYEGLYQINNFGVVKSLERYKNKKTHKEKVSERILKPLMNCKGYLSVYIYKNGKRKMFFIHRLVAQAFIDNPNDYPQVNHKNGIKTDNNVENLEWCTNEYNQKHAQKNNLNKTTKIKLLNNNHEYIFNSIQEAFRFLDKKSGGIYKKYINTEHKFLGYYWKNV